MSKMTEGFKFEFMAIIIRLLLLLIICLIPKEKIFDEYTNLIERANSFINRCSIAMNKLEKE